MLLLQSKPFQFYFYTIISGYGVGQRGDHEKYNSVYSMTGLNSDNVPLANRSDPWDSRMDPVAGRDRYGHTRQESALSDTAMLDNSFKEHSAEPVPQATDFPSEHPNRSNHGGQYDEYNDPYYRGTERPY